MSETPDNTPAYEPKSTLDHAARVGLQTGAVGLVLSSIQNALGSHSHGAMGVLTRTGGTIGFFTAMGATFAFTETYVANERRKNDYINGAAGACAAGFLAGVKARSIPVALGACAFMGATIGAYDSARTPDGETPLTKEEKRIRFFKTPPKPLVDLVD